MADFLTNVTGLLFLPTYSSRYELYIVQSLVNKKQSMFCKFHILEMILVWILPWILDLGPTFLVISYQMPSQTMTNGKFGHF